ncbi:MAG: NAD(P)H-binding protein [Deltaproteobacteria bacterium]|nr:NAD(P)H-binding protein [Deltaproteobacteria bacterium]
MRILVFGATGGTGRNVVERALAAGHDVVAVARKPESIAAKERLTVLKGDVLDAASLPPAFEGVDAVVSCIGPASNSNPGTLLSEGTKNMLLACAKSGVKRFVFESGMICSDGSELSFFGGFAVSVFRRIFPKLYADKIIAESSVTASSRDWVIVRPPALAHKPFTGKYTAGPRAKIFPGNALSHADCADCLLRAATEPAWVKQIVNVGR